MIYGVFIGTKWGMTCNKRQAIQAVKGAGMGEVRELADCPEISHYDHPTFHILSRFIYAKPKSTLMAANN